MDIFNSGLQGRFNYPQTESRIYHRSFVRASKYVQKSGQLILGEGVKKFEENIANWMGEDINSEQVIGVATGTDALELSLLSCDIKTSDQIAVPSHTAYGTVAAILRIGAIPVFIDIGDKYSTISPYDLREKLSNNPKIKALIAVHLYGEACDLKALLKICRDFNIPLIEDCAQAFGTLYEGKPVGIFGDRSAFSFYPTKNLAACGDGGLFISKTKGKKLTYSRRLRFYGWDNSRYAVQKGVNSRLDEIQALILSSKLIDIKKRISQRRKVANFYKIYLEELLSTGDLISIPKDGDNWLHSYHLYVIRIKKEVRNFVYKYCLAKKIPVGIHYLKACHQQPFLSNNNYSLINTEKIVQEIISLPINPYLRKRDVQRVCNILRQGIRQAKNE